MHGSRTDRWQSRRTGGRRAADRWPRQTGTGFRHWLGRGNVAGETAALLRAGRGLTGTSPLRSLGLSSQPSRCCRVRIKTLRPGSGSPNASRYSSVMSLVPFCEAGSRSRQVPRRHFFPPPRLRGAHVPLAAIGCGSKQTGSRRDNLTTPFTVAGLIMRPVEPTWDGQGPTHWMAALGTLDADEESMGMSIPDLMRFSRDKDPGVRLTAVEVLSGFPFNETAPLPALESAQLDPDARVRAAAVQAVQSRKAVDREVQRLRKLWPAGWSEREAAVTLREKSNVSGRCLPSLTLIVRRQLLHDCSV